MLSKASGMPTDDILPTIEPGKMGDLSSRLAFVLAKEKKENPAKIAADIARALNTSTSFSKIEAIGPYINFYLGDDAYATILEDALSKKEKLGKGKKKKGKIIIEFPSVNPNKPWHIGHLRNALLGDAVARILEFDGYDVERMDYINDLGLQVAQSVWGFLNYDSNPSGKFDTWLGHQYVGIAKKFEEDKNVVEGVRDVVKALEEGGDGGEGEGGNEIAKAGRALAERCVLAQYETAFDFGIFHDVVFFESDLIKTIFHDGISFLKQNKNVMLSKEGKNIGCWVVSLGEEFEKEFGKMENPDKVLIRSDGTAVYTGKDIIFHLWKFGKLEGRFKYAPMVMQPNGKNVFKISKAKDGKKMDFGNCDRAINVIGVEQKYPQRVIVEVFRRMGLEKEASSLYHLSYERVGLPDAQFSGRKGTWVGYTADELLAEARTRVKDKIKPDFSESEKESVAKMVGAAAIKFSFLRTTSEKRITFKWDEALNMEGDSGPYLQYAYVRTQGILGKTEEKPGIESRSFNDSEKRLIKQMMLFPEAVQKSSKELSPHHIAQYSLDLAADFSGFYNASPVLVAEDPKVRKTRLAIVLATSIVLRNSLSLIGIECPKRM